MQVVLPQLTIIILSLPRFNSDPCDSVLQCAGRVELEFDLRTGKASPAVRPGDAPYINIIDGPTRSRNIAGPCDGQMVLMLDFSGPFKRAKFELFYGSEPRLWSVLIADSPYSYGFGENQGYTSNCASVLVFNRQLRLFSNMQPDFRYETMDGRNLMNVLDDMVDTGTNLTLEVEDQMARWGDRSVHVKETKHSKFLFSLSGQDALYGPTDSRIYAAFNRVPLGSFQNGSGVCKVRVTFKKDSGKIAVWILAVGWKKFDSFDSSYLVHFVSWHPG